MEMLLQRGEWKGEELCVSECISQTVLAVAIQCGPYCLWVCVLGERDSVESAPQRPP